MFDPSAVGVHNGDLISLAKLADTVSICYCVLLLLLFLSVGTEVVAKLVM